MADGRPLLETVPMLVEAIRYLARNAGIEINEYDDGMLYFDYAHGEYSWDVYEDKQELALMIRELIKADPA